MVSELLGNPHLHNWQLGILTEKCILRIPPTKKTRSKLSFTHRGVAGKERQLNCRFTVTVVLSIYHFSAPEKNMSFRRTPVRHPTFTAAAPLNI